MTTLKDVLDRASRHCSVTPPSSWFSATRSEHLEIRDDFLGETVTNILDRVDLPSPLGKQTVITGTGAASYDLPRDFYRLQRDPLGIYETTTLRRAGTPVSADGVWTHLGQIGGAGAFRYYKIEGYESFWTIKFEEELSVGDSVTVSYVSNGWLIPHVVDTTPSSANADDTITNDNDVMLLPRRVLETGIVWRFRERRGLDFTTALAQYEVEMARLANDSRGVRSVRFGHDASEYKPMRVPVPDHIPST